MPCYDGCREDERQDRETAKKVEAVCGVINASGFGVILNHLDFAECGVSREWLVSWWREHQRKDAERKGYDAARKEAARKQAILNSGDFKRLGAMIEKPIDMMATVLGLQNAVPGGCETLAPPAPTASGVRTFYFGDVRVVEARLFRLPLRSRFTELCAD
jgi:hypothetical protein